MFSRTNNDVTYSYLQIWEINVCDLTAVYKVSYTAKYKMRILPNFCLKSGRLPYNSIQS
jgi:hypothetical protein